MAVHLYRIHRQLPVGMDHLLTASHRALATIVDICDNGPGIETIIEIDNQNKCKDVKDPNERSIVNLIQSLLVTLSTQIVLSSLIRLL